jgi:CubicO group peptidase (beta-lactamase class C family)
VSRRLALLFASLTACSAPAKRPHVPEKPVDSDPDGPHKAAVTAQVQPFLDAEIVDGVVIGLYDQGKLEIYGFGKGPGGAPPTGKTLYEIGSVTKVYTALLLADSVQRREVTLDTAVAELLPPGVVVPSKDKQPITLKHLALHASGLPRLPPSLLQDQKPDPYSGYGEDQLYKVLIASELQDPPGTRIVYSNYGAGLLGFALGKKLGGGYTAIVKERILGPLGLTDTSFGFPAGSEARRAQGTNDDLKPMIPWTFEDALAGAGALVSDARDQLALIDAELDAAAGGKAPLRGAMRFTQEEQLESTTSNTGLGWSIDSSGRYWHNGGTGGFHSFVGFDTKTKRGVVVLASTSTMLVDRLADNLYSVLEGDGAKKPAVFPAPDALVAFAGTYDFQGSHLKVTVDGKRLYIEGPGEPRQRLLPLSDHEFFLEEIQAPVVFNKAEGDKPAAAVFVVGGKMFVAQKLGAN